MTTKQFCEKYEPIINKLSVKYRIPPSKIEEILEHFFGRLKEALHDPRMPTVRIPMLGTFKPSLDKLRRSVSVSLSLLSRDRKSNTKKRDLSLISRIKRNWPILRRLQTDRAKDKIYKTSSFWRRVDPKTYPESYVEEYDKAMEESGFVYGELSESAQKNFSKEAAQRVIENRKESARIRRRMKSKNTSTLDDFLNKKDTKKYIKPFWED